MCLCECAVVCCLKAEPGTECLEDWALWLWLGSSLCCVILDDSPNFSRSQVAHFFIRTKIFYPQVFS